jgi:hypothetical protein
MHPNLLASPGRHGGARASLAGHRNLPCQRGEHRSPPLSHGGARFGSSNPQCRLVSLCVALCHAGPAACQGAYGPADRLCYIWHAFSSCRDGWFEPESHRDHGCTLCTATPRTFSKPASTCSRSRPCWDTTACRRRPTTCTSAASASTRRPPACSMCSSCRGRTCPRVGRPTQHRIRRPIAASPAGAMPTSTAGHRGGGDDACYRRVAARAGAAALLCGVWRHAAGVPRTACGGPKEPERPPRNSPAKDTTDRTSAAKLTIQPDQGRHFGSARHEGFAGGPGG